MPAQHWYFTFILRTGPRDVRLKLAKCATPGANSNPRSKLFGVSVDSAASHRKFIKEHGLPFPLLSDPDRAIVEAYQVWVEKSMYGKKYMGTERTTYLIGTDQKIKAILKKVKSTGHVAQLLQVLDS